MSTIAPLEVLQTEQLPSLLCSDPHAVGGHQVDPSTRRDLFFDQLLVRLTQGRSEYHLDEWFTTLVPAQEVAYRHEVFRDLRNVDLREGLTQFSEQMRRARRILIMLSKLDYQQEQDRWFLEAAHDHVVAISALADCLKAADLTSRALVALAHWVEDYQASARFRALRGDAGPLRDQFAAIRYRVRLGTDWVEVRHVDSAEHELAPRVLALFERFQQDAPTSYLKEIRDPGAMDHVEAAIASFVARLHPEVFASLAGFRTRYQPLLPPELNRVERELQFYLAYLDLMDGTAPAGVTWTLPEIDPGQKMLIRNGFDIVLVLGGSGLIKVPGDCTLAGDERIVVVTGPNQGGKTTFARMLGQVHLLAATGAPVPASRARLPVVDEVFTLFERGENIEDLRGHLHDDLTRAHALLQRVTSRSLVLLNEVYSSTTPDDAVALGQDLLTRLEKSGTRTVAVTFLDELSRLTPTTVSLVAGVDPHDPARRTYRMERRPADGLAYARALAERHELTAAELHRRLAR